MIGSFTPGMFGNGRTFGQLWGQNLELGQMSSAKNANMGLVAGKNCTASNTYGISLGGFNSAPPFAKSGTSTRSGYSPQIGSVLLGAFNFATSSSYMSVAVGLFNNQSGATLNATSGTAKGIQAIKAGTVGAISSAFGINNSSSGYLSLAMGYANSNGSSRGTAAGYANACNGNNALALGAANTTAGNQSTACGYKNNSQALNSHSVGQYNFTSSGAFATVNFGLLNNQQTGSLSSSTGVITGTPAAAGTIGKLSSALGILNLTAGAQATAVGFKNVASGTFGTAAGYNNTASGTYCSAVGYQNTASTGYSSAFGYKNTSSGYKSVALGYTNTSSATGSVALGWTCGSTAANASSIGYTNTANGANSTACGYQNNMQALNSNAFGGWNFSTNTSYAAASIGLMNNSQSATFTPTTGVISGTPSAATTIGRTSLALGVFNLTAGNFGVAAGYHNTASGVYSVASGYKNTASGSSSVSIGNQNSAGSGAKSTACGYKNTAANANASAIGSTNTASANQAEAFGYSCTASAANAVAMGRSCTASASYAQAFGALVNNSVANSFEAGADNTNKIHTDANGIQFAAKFLPQMLASSSAIDATATGNTTLYTVPAGKTCIVLWAIVKPTNVNTVTTGPTASIQDGSGNAIVASLSMAAMTTTSQFANLSDGGMIGAQVAAAGTVRINIGTGAVATTYQVVVDLFGYLY
jgi:hypothetical protein